MAPLLPASHRRRASWLRPQPGSSLASLALARRRPCAKCWRARVWRDRCSMDVIELDEAFSLRRASRYSGALCPPDDAPSRELRMVALIALGHPLGMSGARLATTATWHLRGRRRAACPLYDVPLQRSGRGPDPRKDFEVSGVQRRPIAPPARTSPTPGRCRSGDWVRGHRHQGREGGSGHGEKKPSPILWLEAGWRLTG